MEGSDGESDGESDDEPVTKKAKGRRRQVVDDEDDSEPSPCRKSQRVAQLRGAKGAVAGGPKAQRAVGIAHPATLAATQRAPSGRLPEHSRVVIDLMQLQVNLMREGRHDDSAACTAAIFTMQELMDPAGQLRFSSVHHAR